MRLLLLSPHTDDVELGAGGTVVKFLQEGHEIYWAVFSTAEKSLPANAKPGTLKKEFMRVVTSLQNEFGNIHSQIFDYEVRRLNFYRQDVLDDLISIRKEFKPDLVIGPSLNDFHQDHTTVAYEMVRAFKNTSKIISYELPWNHITFETRLFVRLKKEHVDRKWALLKNYATQFIKKRSYFSEEYIYGLAKVRGTQCNATYAEAFEVVRWTL